jgi:redox-sensitive bicupin YhaK (pirin superfamily)
MLALRKASERGITRVGWLDSRHTFSFGDYADPKHQHFRSLRVINDDRVAPASGFGMHPHRDMEILTYVLSGQLEHRDSMGHGEVIRAGEWQKMTAGTGIRHSEFNPSETDPVHLLQIWIFPARRGLTPGYEQRFFPEEEKRGRWRTIASPDGRDGSMVVQQDAVLSAAVLKSGEAVRYSLAPTRGAWLHVATGTVTVNGRDLGPGDSAAVEHEAAVEVVGGDGGEVLLFDLG